MKHYSILLSGLVSLLYFSASNGALAKTLVIPHIIEKSGSIKNTTFTFDSTIVLTYNGSLNGNDTKSATVDLYLYDEATGQLMRGTSSTVCGPCSYALSAKQRKVTIQLDDLITTNGGGFDTVVKLGFAILVISGDGADAVNAQGFVVNSHTSGFDLSVFGFEPQPIAASAARTVVLPHVLESSGSAATSSSSFDTEIHMTYTGGLPGGSSGGGSGGAS